MPPEWQPRWSPLSLTAGFPVPTIAWLGDFRRASGSSAAGREPCPRGMIRSSAAQTTGPPSFARVRSDVSREVLPRPRQLDANLIRQAPPEQRVQ